MPANGGRDGPDELEIPDGRLLGPRVVDGACHDWARVKLRAGPELEPSVKDWGADEVERSMRPVRGRSDPIFATGGPRDGFRPPPSNPPIPPSMLPVREAGRAGLPSPKLSSNELSAKLESANVFSSSWSSAGGGLAAVLDGPATEARLSYVMRCDGRFGAMDECGRRGGRLGGGKGWDLVPCQDWARWNLRMVWISEARLAT